MLAPCIALILLRAQVSIHDPEGHPPSLQDVKDVARAYQRSGLPLPPKGAVLSSWIQDDSVPSRKENWVYLLPGQVATGQVFVLAGTQLIKVPRESLRAVILKSDDPPPNPRWYWSMDRSFGEPSELTLVAAEALRGHLELARKLLAQGGYFYDYRLRSDNNIPYGDSNRMTHLVGCLSVLHWVNESLIPGSDRRKAAAGIEKALKEFPSVSTEWSRGVLKSLRATLDPKYVREGENEALVEALLQCSMDGKQLESPDPGEEKKIEPLIAIVEKGFDMVPTLIGHLEDERLTRAWVPPMMNGAGDVVRVSDVCRNILNQYRGGAQANGKTEENRLIRKWWVNVKPGDEAELCLTRLTSNGAFSPDASIVQAKKRFPGILLHAFYAILKTGKKVQTWPLLEAMEASSLDRQLVESAALAGCKSANRDTVSSALGTLWNLKSGGFEAEMIKALDSIPADAMGGWLDVEDSFAHIAANSDSPAVWDALRRAARRANVDLRLELLQTSSYVNLRGKDLKVRIKFFSSFFDDPAVAHKKRKDPNDPKLEDDLHTGSRTLKIALMARIQAAHILNVEVPGVNATQAQWTKFIATVDSAVAAFLGAGTTR